MKQLALILGLLSFNALCAMEQEDKISLSEPYYEQRSKQFIIKATYQAQEIGHIHYRSLKKETKWEIKELLVSEQYRNSGKKIGFHLFNAAIKDIYSKNPHKIQWTVTPIKDCSVSLEELITIYQKIVSKLALPSNTTFKQKHFFYATDMALKFK